MEDNFRKYVNKHEDEIAAFYEEDMTGLWDKISDELDAKEKKTSGLSWKIAAVLLAFFISGYVAYKFGQYSSQLPQELAEAETHYVPLISKKMSLINAHRNEIGGAIWDDMEQIDQACSELKNDLKDQVDNEEVINAIIQNYRIKLEILDQLLQEIEEKNDDSKEKSSVGL